MVNLVGSMCCSHDSIWNTRALEMGSDIRIYNVAWDRAVPSIIRGTSLVPLLFLAKKYDSIMRIKDGNNRGINGSYKIIQKNFEIYSSLNFCNTK